MNKQGSTLHINHHTPSYSLTKTPSETSSLKPKNLSLTNILLKRVKSDERLFLQNIRNKTYFTQYINKQKRSIKQHSISLLNIPSNLICFGTSFPHQKININIINKSNNKNKQQTSILSNKFNHLVIKTMRKTIRQINNKQNNGHKFCKPFKGYDKFQSNKYNQNQGYSFHIKQLKNANQNCQKPYNGKMRKEVTSLRECQNDFLNDCSTIDGWEVDNESSH